MRHTCRISFLIVTILDMAVRNTYTLRDERLMWQYVFE